MGIGLAIGVVVFILVLFKGDLLTSIFTTEKAVILQGYAYLKGFALETIVTAILFSMIGYFNGHYQTVWVMVQGLIQTLLFLIRRIFCVGATVAIAVAIEEAVNIDEYFIALSLQSH